MKSAYRRALRLQFCHGARERISGIGRALRELAEAMARLTPGDLSLYHSVITVGHDGDPSIMTTVGSPNHSILVQMTDLRLAVPEERKSLGAPPHMVEIVRYRITRLGQAYVPKLLGQAVRLRHPQSSR